MTGYPEWFPHEHPDYESHLQRVTAAELDRIRTDSSARRAVLADSRDVHRRMYGALAPPGHPEYAGTYRGTPGTTLEQRDVSARRILTEGTIDFARHDLVAKAMGNLGTFIANQLDLAPRPRADEFAAAVKIFYLFGRIHPFLDGNGHIQRLIFAAIARERGLTLFDVWTVHPRPYQEEMAAAFEQADPLSAVHALLGEFVA